VAKPDLRMPALGVAAWAGALVTSVLAPPVVIGVTAVASVTGLAAAVRRGSRVLVALVLVFTAVAAGALVRHERVTTDPVAQLAGERAAVTVRLVVTSDPRPVTGGFGDGVMLRGSVRTVTGRGSAYRVRAPVLVLAGPALGGGSLGCVRARHGQARAAPGRTGLGRLVGRDVGLR
jgi:competence protein ComEC